jgi:hypothetical protein
LHYGDGSLVISEKRETALALDIYIRKGCGLAPHPFLSDRISSQP